MAFSFLLGLDEFKVLSVYYRISQLPLWLKDINVESQDKVWTSLVDKQLCKVNRNIISINTALDFLLKKAAKHKDIIVGENGEIVYINDGINILLKLDMRNETKCVITPYQSIDECVTDMFDKEDAINDE